jgi:hypothetical protein
MAYILDDRLVRNSVFHKIINNNKLNFESFLKDAHKTKKPDRLRQYITEDCPYTQKTVLLHAGRERVTQTLKRDLDGLFTLLEKRVCLALCEHEADFYSEVFRTVLEEIKDHGRAIGENPNSSLASNVSISRGLFEADFYYEGKSTLSMVEQVLRAESLGVEFISPFSLG